MSTDVTNSITFAAAALAGFAGSAHCFSMCGGIMGALSTRRAAGVPRLQSILFQQLGRIGGYASAGLALGWLGSTVAMTSLPMLSQAMRVTGGVLIVLLAVRILCGWNALRSIERLGAIVWRQLRPALRYATSRGSSNVSSLLTGLLWGWMPCGLVYTMLILAGLGGDAARGAGVMIAFGLGTLPSVLAGSYLFTKLPEGLRKWSPRYANGVLLLAFGVWLSVSAVSGSHADHLRHASLQGTHVHVPLSD